MSGIFITFEGVEGAGKSTQVAKTSDFLKNLGHDVIITREPGGSFGAERIREMLVKGTADQWTDLTECLLMNASRAENLDKLIRPALADGKTVLCDRFMDSTRAYQGGAGGIDQDILLQIEAAVVSPTQPDLTLIFDMPVPTGLARASARGGDDRFEKKGADYHERVRRAFLAIAKAEPARCALISADQPVENVFQDVLAALQKHLKIG